MGPERAARYLRKFYPWYLERLGADAGGRGGAAAERRARRGPRPGRRARRAGAGPRLMGLTPRVSEWRDRGGAEEVAGRRIHVFRRDGEGPLLLLLHGFPSSSYDWRLLLESCRSARCSPTTASASGSRRSRRDHDYTLGEQADIAEELVGRHGAGRPVFLVGHDMGTSVATELMARDIDGTPGSNWSGGLLFNGSMIQSAASPTLAQRLLRGPPRPGRWPGSRASASSASSSARSSPRAIRSATRRPPTSGAWSPTRAAQRLGHRLISYMDERERHAAALARGAPRLGRSPCTWPGGWRTRWRPRTCSTRCPGAAPAGAADPLRGPRPLPADRGPGAPGGRAGRPRSTPERWHARGADRGRRYNAALARPTPFHTSVGAGSFFGQIAGIFSHRSKRESPLRNEEEVGVARDTDHRRGTREAQGGAGAPGDR